jgi:transcriptional regulator with XRE-family HTH domain
MDAQTTSTFRIRSSVCHPMEVTRRAANEITQQLISDIAEKGISRSQLAARAQMDVIQINRVLNGDHNVTLFTLGKVAAALGKELRISFDGGHRFGVSF